MQGHKKTEFEGDLTPSCTFWGTLLVYMYIFTFYHKEILSFMNLFKFVSQFIMIYDKISFCSSVHPCAPDYINLFSFVCKCKKNCLAIDHSGSSFSVLCVFHDTISLNYGLLYIVYLKYGIFLEFLKAVETESSNHWLDLNWGGYLGSF